ncbi:MAG: hypothetical protein LBN39_13125 [Planctomycetaceae bacterium]|jgi:hypothetical protein|nr:hypothetical protein [Planctomycetaceae bacterium]
MFIILAVFIFVFSSVLSAEEQNSGAGLAQMLLKMDDTDWDTLGSEDVPLEQQIEPVLAGLYKLQHTVPASFLKTGVFRPFPDKGGLPLSALAEDPSQFRGKIFELKGDAVHVQELPLNPVQQKEYKSPAYYRCKITIGENTAEVLTFFVPAEWKRNEAIREHVLLRGIYIKRENGKQLTPLLLSPKIEWYPNTFLGNLGFDVSSLEQVPALNIAALKNKDLQLPERKEILQRAFKFTAADRDPFYGLLKALSALPAGRLEQEARSENKTNSITVADLFLKPAETRGKPVLLNGTAKRVVLTPVEDKEVQTLYGIDKYYQIYLYPKESQGNPLVVCVRSLPAGMPAGSDSDYAEEISVAAVPYKLWIYESAEKLEGKDGNKPGYAPLLIGRSPVWLPKTKPAEKVAPPSPALFYASFAVMFAVWFLLRAYRRRAIHKNIEFKLKK